MSISVATLRVIFESELSDAALTACISAASLLVTETLSQSSMSQARLNEIEKWLAAHIASQLDSRYQVDTITLTTRESVKFGGKLGDLLKWSFFGQTALILDSSGALANAGKQQARFLVVRPGVSGTLGPADFPLSHFGDDINTDSEDTFI